MPPFSYPIMSTTSPPVSELSHKVPKLGISDTTASRDISPIIFHYIVSNLRGGIPFLGIFFVQVWFFSYVKEWARQPQSSLLFFFKGKAHFW